MTMISNITLKEPFYKLQRNTFYDIGIPILLLIVNEPAILIITML